MTDATYAVDEWEWWRLKLAGEPVEMNEGHPHAGFYRMPHKEHYGAKKTYAPVAYWPDGNGGLNCRIDGKDVPQQRGRDIWTHVGDHPVTQEAYHNKCEDEEADGSPNPNYTGRWPDEHELVPMDRRPSNQPPAEDTFESLRDEIEDLAREAKERIEGPPIADQAEADRLGNLSDRLAELWKKADASRKVEKAPFDEAAKKVHLKWTAILLKAETYKNLKFKLLTPWLLKIKAAKEEEARENAAVGTVPIREKTPRAGNRGRAITLKAVKYAKISDYAACLQFFAENPDVKQLVQDLANRMVRAGVAVPGTEVIEEQQAV